MLSAPLPPLSVMADDPKVIFSHPTPGSTSPSPATNQTGKQSKPCPHPGNRDCLGLASFLFFPQFAFCLHFRLLPFNRCITELFVSSQFVTFNEDLNGLLVLKPFSGENDFFSFHNVCVISSSNRKHILLLLFALVPSNVLECTLKTERTFTSYNLLITMSFRLN